MQHCEQTFYQKNWQKFKLKRIFFFEDSVCLTGLVLEENGTEKIITNVHTFWRVWIFFTNLLFIPEAQLLPSGRVKHSNQNPPQLRIALMAEEILPDYVLWFSQILFRRSGKAVAVSHFRNTWLAKSYFWSFLLKLCLFLRFSVFLNQLPSHSLPEGRYLCLF